MSQKKETGTQLSQENHQQILENPRFWKGLVTQSRDQGEIQLILCWEQGYDYSEVRVITFTLNYWHAGIKDVMTETLSKRRLDQFIAKARATLPDDVTLVDCTLAEGKRLIEEALSVNQWYGNAPDKSYRQQLPFINKLILEATDLGEDRGYTFITPELEEQEVIINFLGAWSFGDYGLAYDLLTHDSSVPDGLSRDEWIERHRVWHEEAHPTRMRLGFVHERDGDQSALQLPSSVGLRSPLRKNIEIGWSLELSNTPLSGTLKEMPMGTAVNKETGRHWFWTSYILVREEGVWRIQQATDEGMALQSLSIHELQSRIKEYQQVTENLARQQHANMEQALEEVSRRLTQMLYFYDVLLTLLPLDYQIHQEAYAHVNLLTEDLERIIAYLELIIQRFPEKRADNLRQLSATLLDLAHHYDPQKMPERVKHLLQRADETVQQAIQINPESAHLHALLASVLLEQGDRRAAQRELEEAERIDPQLEVVQILRQYVHSSKRK